MDAKFTIILLNYNQDKYIFESLDSIIEQDYKNIELVITDDGSQVFPQEEIENYLKENNFNNYKFLINDNNIGTVKTINKALKAASGNYLLIFAADDKLYDKNVISNYVNTFKKIDKKIDIVTAQTHMCDENLAGKPYTFVTNYYVDRVNNFDSKKLFNDMTIGCIFSSGATAYRRSLFDRIKCFDEKYKLIEDWPFYLKCSREGIKFHYENFVGLKHRSGGVSHYKQDELPPHVIQYYTDIYNIYKNEIVPYANKLDLNAKLIAMKEFNNYYKKYGNKTDKLSLYYYFYIIYIAMKNNYYKLIKYISDIKFLILNVLLLQFIYVNNLHYKFIGYYCIIVMLLLISKPIIRKLKNIYNNLYVRKNKKYL